MNTPLYVTQGEEEKERAKEKAQQLLRQVLPEHKWREFEEKGIIQYEGKNGVYEISPYSQTVIRDSESGRCLAYACLALSISAPKCDRVVAEYLLLKNAEDVYWKTANVFSRRRNEPDYNILWLGVLVMVLLANLILIATIYL